MKIQLSSMICMNPACRTKLSHDFNTDISSIDNVQLKHDFMKGQTKINSRMRAILIEWLLEVSYKFKLQEHTIDVAVLTLDVYISNVQIH